MTAAEHGLAQRMWHQLEPVHGVFWSAPQVFAAAAALGYDVETRWPSYFAWRLAPLGAVGPRLAASACYSFSPDNGGRPRACRLGGGRAASDPGGTGAGSRPDVPGAVR
jgi:hypothetical protein